MYRFLKRFSGVGTGNYIFFWQSKGLPHENITAPTRSDFKFKYRIKLFW